MWKALAENRRWAFWVARRLAAGVVVLFFVTLLIFIATQALPGDPAQAILGAEASPERVAALREELDLNRPLVTQYLDWLGGVVQGDLGTSYGTTSAPVSSLLGAPLRNSLVLLFLSAVIAVPVGVLVGALAAFKRDGPIDKVFLYSSLVLIAVPEFVVGMALLLLFSTTVFHWLPAIALFDVNESPWDRLDQLVLPAATLIIAVVLYIARLVRGAMITVLESDYVQMARLKGLSERRVVLRHAISNAWVPGIQATAQSLVFLLAGAVVVEYLFRYPGVGSLLLGAISLRNMPMIQAVVLVFAAFVVIVNVVADLLMVYATPRLRTAR